MLETIDFDAAPMDKQEYKQIHDSQMSKLLLLQQQAHREGLGIVVLFEGWGGAGKGSRISDLMYNLDARMTSVHVTEDIDDDAISTFAGRDFDVYGFYPEMQQFWNALGERGAMTIYDRGWYTSALERSLFDRFGSNLSENEIKELLRSVMGNTENGATVARRARDYDVIESYRNYAYNFERMLVRDGYVVIKLFVHVREDVREKRIKKLYENPTTRYRVSKFKFQHIKDYARAYQILDKLISDSNFDFAPWTIVNGEDKRKANVTIAQTIIDSIERALNQKAEKQLDAAQKEALKNFAEHSLETGAIEGVDRARIAPPAPLDSEFIIMSGYPRINHEEPKPTIDDTVYKTELKREQNRLFNLENEMYQKRIPLMVMFEGWDAAGKGGAIKRVAQALDARAYTVFPSPAPTPTELAHPHLWRYWTRLPKAGHVGIYDRSWYGRVLVERIEGFAAPDEWRRAYDEINEFEYELVQWGAILLKFWVDVTPDEQLARFESRAEDPLRQWKITEEDWRNRDKYPQYREAVDDMFRLTSTLFAPWVVLDSNDKKYARIKALKTINDALEQRMHGNLS